MNSKTKGKKNQLTWWHWMRCISYQSHPPLMVVPLLWNPIADIGLVDLGIFRNPQEGRPRRLAQPLGSLLDQVETLFVAEFVVVVTHPCHGQVEDP